MRFKESAKVHAEGYSAGEFKHGPLALADETTPFIFIVNDDEYFQDMIYALSQVKHRHATTIVITDCPHKVDSTLVDHFVEVPQLGMLTSLMSIFPIQLIAYYIALEKGHNPDNSIIN